MSAEIDYDRRRFLGSAAMTIVAAQFGMIGSVDAEPSKAVELASLDSATAWLNSQPLTVAGLRGKVVLVQFWTYSCINWLRTLPYARAWAEKYKVKGLVVIGVHSPEFAFEKNVDNVRWAAKNMRVDYPIAIDSDHATGMLSKTNTGLPSTSSMRRGSFDIISSAKANTNSQKKLSNNC